MNCDAVPLLDIYRGLQLPIYVNPGRGSWLSEAIITVLSSASHYFLEGHHFSGRPGGPRRGSRCDLREVEQG